MSFDQMRRIAALLREELSSSILLVLLKWSFTLWVCLIPLGWITKGIDYNLLNIAQTLLQYGIKAYLVGWRPRHSKSS